MQQLGGLTELRYLDLNGGPAHELRRLPAMPSLRGLSLKVRSRRHKASAACSGKDVPQGRAIVMMLSQLGDCDYATCIAKRLQRATCTKWQQIGA